MAIKHLPGFFSTAALAIIVTLGASAQTSASPPRTTVRVFGPTVGFGPAGSAISPKQHAPFSAVLVQQNEETLSDGTHISREYREIVMRDDLGRIYRDRELRPADGTKHRSNHIFTIADATENVQYVCHSLPKSCRKMAYRVPMKRLQPSMDRPRKQRNITVEDLGSASISGIEVLGERVTWLIREGQVGNDRPFSSIEEKWHSNELDVDVQVKRSDPRAGTRTNTLTDISLGEPDPRYFQPPEGYHVFEGYPHATGAMSPLTTESEYSYPGGTLPPHQ